ncbi:hypothetical protein UFOVP1040_29 [uncultured Caudovirales phage]|uniref:Uncharacterized protein n=1 Tax=uncultured Caudovirales phage TaxID=2100421 RepID=A0A6J5QF16_9CAUD|nr:hypothetical protein UFOVP1040_29 [uncultured Caudovirales phage]
MTTKSTKPVRRETSAFVRERGLRPLVVTIVDSVILLRPKGLRSEEMLDLASCYFLAVKQRVAREQAERRARRKGK